MSQYTPRNNSSHGQDDFDPKDSLAWRSPETIAKRHREDCLELLGKDGEFCQGGLLCSEPPSVGTLCLDHFLDESCRPRRTTPSSGSTTSTETPPANATETCHLQDLLLSNYIPLADDDDATSEYDEAGAPPTEGGDEGQYESPEADIDAGTVDYQGDEGTGLLVAASIPLPETEEDSDLEEVDQPAGQLVELEDAGSNFHLPGVNWSWPSETLVASLVKRKPETHALRRIFPPAQGYTVLASGRFKCTVRARISPGTGRWEAYDCSGMCKRQYDWRRHLLTIHLAGSRWEDVARQKKMDAEDSTSTEPKKPRAKRVPRQAQPLASTSTSASTSTAGPPPEVQLEKPRQKRRRQVTEDAKSEDDYEDRDQGECDRKGKKARRW